MAELGAHAAVTDTPDRDGAIGTPAATHSKLSAHKKHLNAGTEHLARSAAAVRGARPALEDEVGDAQHVDAAQPDLQLRRVEAGRGL